MSEAKINALVEEQKQYLAEMRRLPMLAPASLPVLSAICGLCLAADFPTRVC